MRKGLFLLGATVAVLSSCSNQEVMDVADYANQPIEFSTFVGKNTRAGDVTDADFSKFWVFAKNKGASESTWHDAFINVQVNKGSDDWRPINTYYWEQNKEFRFAGYSNGNDDGQLETTSQVSYDPSTEVSGSTNTGLLTFTNYKTDGKNDLVAAMGNEDDYTWKGDVGDAPAVEMTFHHMLTKLSFTFKTNAANSYELNVTNLRIVAAHTQGTGTYHKGNGGTINWTTIGTPTDNESETNYSYKYEFDDVADIANGTADASSEYHSVKSEDLYVIPQTCNTIKVRFTAVLKNDNNTIGTQDFEATLSYTKAQSGEEALTDNEWTAGYYYNYTAELKVEDIQDDDNAKPITFDSSVETWKNTTAGDDLNLTERNS